MPTHHDRLTVLHIGRICGRTWPSISVLVVAVLLAAFASHAAAQDVRIRTATPWSASFESPLRSAITDDVVQSIIDDDRLDLSEKQVDRIETLADEHRRRFERWLESIADTIREHQQRLRDLHGGTLEHHHAELDREEAFAKIADRQAELDDRFFREVEAVLEEEQLSAWRHWQHRYVLARWQHKARLMDAAIKFVALIERIEREDDGLEDLRDDEDLDALLTEYAAAMHRAVTDMAEHAIARSRRHMRDMEDRYMTDGERVWIGPHPEGREGFRAETREIHQTSERVRRVNRQYFEPIRATLPAEARAAFTDVWQRRMLHLARSEAKQFDLIFWFRDAVRIVESFEDLTEKQAEIVDALKIEYREAMTPRLRTLIRRQEEAARARLGLDGGGRDAQQRTEEAYLDEFDRVVEYDRAMIEHLREILTNEQRERFDDERPGNSP